jgi:hypothetical protein
MTDIPCKTIQPIAMMVPEKPPPPPQPWLNASQFEIIISIYFLEYVWYTVRITIWLFSYAFIIGNNYSLGMVILQNEE